MRGTLWDDMQRFSGRGIIPAYAGNTFGTTAPRVTYGDHPRVCGEHYFIVTNDGFQVGSSPRMRGTHAIDWCPIVATGIIPAYAGNTMIQVAPMGAIRDHPRVCGEHIRIAW